MSKCNSFFDNIYNQAKRTDRSFVESIKYVQRDKFDELPIYLFKFYRPTANSVLDIFNGQLYLSSTNSFNDIFDSTIGGNKELYIKSRMLQELKKQIGEVDYITVDMYSDLRNRSTKKNRWDDSFFQKIEIYYKAGNKGWLEVLNLKKDIQKEFDDIIKKANEEYYRVGCFIGSDNADNIINNAGMWGHYADDNRGFCVVYDMQRLKNFDYLQKRENYKDINEKLLMKELQANFFKVRYDNIRPSMSLDLMKKVRKGNGGLVLEKLYYKTCTTKARCWSKENEYRLIIHKDSDYLVNNKIEFPFIKAIYIGARMDKSLRSALYDFAESKKININTMKPCANKYELEDDISFLIERMWESNKKVNKSNLAKSENTTNIEKNLKKQIQGLNEATDREFVNLYLESINMIYDRDKIKENIIHDEGKSFYKLQGDARHNFCWNCWNNWNRVTLLYEYNSRYSYDKDIKYKCSKCINQLRTGDIEE